MSTDNVGTEEKKELTLADIANRLNEYYVAKGEKTLELLVEKRKEIEDADPPDVEQKEGQITELEASLDSLPDVAKETIVEKIESLKKEVTLKKSMTVATVDNHITAVKERLAFLRLYGF